SVIPMKRFFCSGPQLPQDIADSPALQAALDILPSNYNFELHKTAWRIRQCAANRIALQFPEGLQMFACTIADALHSACNVDCVLLGDVAYGACCVDDYTAVLLGCQLLVHYGHSCLVPIDQTASVKMLYVFVDIAFDTQHLLDSVRTNLSSQTRLALLGIVQFVASLQSLKKQLEDSGFSVIVPQCKPLSPGEVLGCTAPRLQDTVDAILFIGDGRFHLESAMLANPHLPAYQYNPYDKRLTCERFAHDEVLRNRQAAIEAAKSACTFGIIQGSLGRQGSVRVVQRLEERLAAAGKSCITLLMSEIFPAKLALFPDVEAWVQVACPRLSVDWGAEFPKPLLTPYELCALLGEAPSPSIDYPTDFYAYESLGDWTPNHRANRIGRVGRTAATRTASALVGASEQQQSCGCHGLTGCPNATCCSADAARAGQAQTVKEGV
ncbi:hypothetical protein BOX15_Mlig023288g1, partial [Macrostomum lignano]